MKMTKVAVHRDLQHLGYRIPAATMALTIIGLNLKSFPSKK